MFFRHSAFPLSELLCLTVLVWKYRRGRSEQERSDIKHRAALSCTWLEGRLDVLLNMDKLMAGQPSAPVPEKGEACKSDIYEHTRETTGQRHSNKEKECDHLAETNEAIRDSLMVRAGRVCGISLIIGCKKTGKPGLILGEQVRQ